MKVYMTIVTDSEDDLSENKTLDAVLGFAEIMNATDTGYMVKITNMPREYPGFKKASEI